MANWTQESLEQALRARGWYKSQKPIGNGIQYRLVDETPVSFYPSTGKVLVQGRETPLKKEVKKLLEGDPVETDVSASSPSSVAGSPVPQAGGEQPESAPPKRVFIVYGHDTTACELLDAMLRRLGLKPIVLRNRTGGGNTIIENLDKYTDADFACVLLTPDDEGKSRDGDQPLRPRARQNVVLELGMVLARLGRQRVAILVKDTNDEPIERPTDIEGIIYIPFTEHIKEIGNKLVRRLREVGFSVTADDLED